MYHAACFLALVLQSDPQPAAAGAAPMRAPAALEAAYDLQRLAVRAADARMSAAAVQTVLQSAGIACERVQRVQSDGWYLVDLPSALPDEAAAMAGVARLAGADGLAFAAPVLRGARGRWGAPTQELLLRLPPGARASAAAVLARLAPDFVVEAADFAGLEGAYLLSLATRDGFSVLEEARRLQATGELEWVEPRLLCSGAGASAPNDPLYGDQWGFKNTGQDLGFGPGVAGFDMNLEEAQDLGTGSSSIGVLVIDVGVQATHPDMTYTTGADFMIASPVGQPGTPQNACDNHGTAVAGVVSASRDNGLDIAGVAPGCKLISARCFESLTPFCDESWTTFFGTTAQSLDFGIANGARVSVNSNAYGFTEASLESKYAETRAAGMVHLAAAGNSSNYGVEYPAVLTTIWAVGGTDEFATSYGYTAIGPEVDFAGPAFDVRTLDRSGAAGYESGDTALVEGTSFAAPHLGGLAALLLSLDPALDADGVGEILKAASVEQVSDGVNAFQGKDLISGYGQPDARIACELAAGLYPRLVAEGGPVSVWQGGAQSLKIHAGAARTGDLYLVLGSVSGTSPGFAYPPVTVPLNLDSYFLHTLAHPNGGPVFTGLGFLNALGEATASFAAPVLGNSLAGTTANHAAVLLDLAPALSFPVPPTNPKPVLLSDAAFLDATGTPLSIPDSPAPGIASNISASGLGSSITQVNLVTDITHPYYGDIELRLLSPAGTSVLVHAANSSENYVNMKVVWGGYFSTTQSMGLFNGQDPNGTWQLKVTDKVGGDSGTLLSWKLIISSH